MLADNSLSQKAWDKITVWSGDWDNQKTNDWWNHLRTHLLTTNQGEAYNQLNHIQNQYVLNNHDGREVAARIFSIINTKLQGNDHQQALSTLSSMLKDCKHCNVGTRERLLRILQGYVIQGTSYTMDGTDEIGKLDAMRDNFTQFKTDLFQALSTNHPDLYNFMAGEEENLTPITLQLKKDKLHFHALASAADMIKRTLFMDDSQQPLLENPLFKDPLFCFMWGDLLYKTYQSVEDLANQYNVN